MNPPPPRQLSRRIRAATTKKKRAARSTRGRDATDEVACPTAETTTAGDDFWEIILMR